MVKNVVSFIHSFMILVKMWIFEFSRFRVLDGTVWFIVLTWVLSV